MHKKTIAEEFEKENYHSTVFRDYKDDVPVDFLEIK